MNKQNMEPSIFSLIVEGKIPSYKIAEDERFFAFLDVHPVQIGHTLVIPKKQIDYFFDLPDDLLGGIVLFARPIANAIVRAFGCKRCGLSVVGLEVPHVHMHMIPINDVSEMSFERPKLSLTPQQFLAAQNLIVAELDDSLK